VLRVGRAFGVAAVAALVLVAAGCGGSGSSSPSTTAPTTTQTNTIPKQTTSLVVKNFPSTLTGGLTFHINSAQGKPNEPGAWKRRYTVTLNNLVLRLAGISGTGDTRQARYHLVSADEGFTGFENLTSSKCKTSHIVWAGTNRKPTGTVEVFGPKFDSSVGFVFLVPQQGKTVTRACNASSGGTKATVTRTARIEGNANLNLLPGQRPTKRFLIGIEIQSSTAGPQSSGGYTISGSLNPASEGSPVTLCHSTNGKLNCNVATS
jgi:hypothetical protein